MLKEILRTPDLSYTPIGLVDDDPRKKNMPARDPMVLGTSDELPHLLRDRRPDGLLITVLRRPVNSAPSRRDRARRERAVKTLPGLNELIAGDLDLAKQVRPVEVEDLAGREPVEVDVDAIASVKDKVVLVTGAGGSIGSDSAASSPRRAEADRGGRPGGELALRDRAGARRRAALQRLRAGARRRAQPHAAAAGVRALPPRRRLPRGRLQARAADGGQPLESVANNVLGTRVVAGAAIAHGVERFVLISTDKALNPYSVYGQSKTLCRRIVGSHGERDDVPTKFVAVRFGNVLQLGGQRDPSSAARSSGADR